MTIPSKTLLQSRPWQQSYQCYHINPNIVMPAQSTSLLDVFEDSLKKNAKRDACLSMGTHFTYKELDIASKKVAAYLQQLGLVKGDKVAVMLPNIIQYPVVALGVIRAGMVLVNVNPLYTSSELGHQLQDSGAKALFILENFVSTYQGAKYDGVDHVIVCRLGDMLGKIKGTVINLAAKYVKKLVPAWRLSKFTWFDEILKTKARRYQRPKLHLDDVALLQYTGGTTGVAKGAMLSHGNLIANVLQCDALINSAFSDKERNQPHIVLTALPLYHVLAFTLCYLYVCKMGYTQLLIANPRDVNSMLNDIKKYPLTFFIGVNTLFSGLAHNPKFRALNFDKLKVSIGGGMSVSTSVASEWQNLTGTPIVEGYGLSECAPVVAFNPITIDEFTGKIGIPAPSTDVILIDDDENPVPLGERGEIAVQGPQVMLGYQNRSQETKEAFTKSGYLKTGDIGVMDAQGFIKLVDRKKEMILVSGFNVYPNEIEEVLMHHPDVLEVGVIGVPHKNSGETPKAFVVRKQHQATENDLLNFAKQHLTGYKRPRIVEFVDSLPKSPVGKILRKELRKLEGLD